MLIHIFGSVVFHLFCLPVCGREYEGMSSRTCHVIEALHFLALEPISFSTTAVYLFVFAV